MTKLKICFQIPEPNNHKGLDYEEYKEVRALRGKFGPLWSPKLKVVVRENHPIGLLEE